jgi:hypothetical protein
MLYQQGFAAYSQRQFDAARHLFEQSLTFYRKAQHTPGILRVLHVLANIAYEEGQYTTAQTLHEEVLAACRAMNFQEGIASSLNNLGLVAGKENRFATLGRIQEATAAQANLEALQQHRTQRHEIASARGE